MADLNEAQASQSVKIAGAAAATGVESNFLQVDTNGNAQVIATSAGSASGGAAASQSDLAGGQYNATAPVLTTGQQSALQVDSMGRLITSPQASKIAADLYTSYSPDYSDFNNGTRNLIVDSAGRLETHSTVLTDEGSFRDDFSGSSLSSAISTCTFTNGGITVTGTGFFTAVKNSDYIKKTADAETLYVQVLSVDSDSSLTLVAAYTGTSGSAAAVRSNWNVSTGAGGSISVASSLANVVSGTTSGSSTYILRNGDYMPYVYETKFAVSQRIVNQIVLSGLVDDPVSTGACACVQFDGTASNVLKFITASSSAAADTQTTTITISGFNSSAQNRYAISLTNNSAGLVINGKVVAEHNDHIPGPYQKLQLINKISNSAVVATTTLTIDYSLFYNTDQVETTSNFRGEPQRTLLQGTSSTTGLPVDLQLDATGNLIVTSLTGFGSDFAFGDITTAALTRTLVRRTIYTEQSTDAQRQIVSASASDAAAGTGARTVKITYLDQNGAGPFTEIVTLNGTTAVNTTATNICYIEQMEVVTAGSGGANAGIITIRTLAAVTIGTIAAGDNQTFWCHHYVPAGKVCNITGISSGHNGTTVGSGALFTLNAKFFTVVNGVEVQISDFVRLYGQTSTFARTYSSPIKVSGPARIQTYVTPESSSSIVYRCAFDFFEP